jgi:hypothetical protein
MTEKRILTARDLTHCAELIETWSSLIRGELERGRELRLPREQGDNLASDLEQAAEALRAVTVGHVR